MCVGNGWHSVARQSGGKFQMRKYTQDDASGKKGTHFQARPHPDSFFCRACGVLDGIR